MLVFKYFLAVYFWAFDLYIIYIGIFGFYVWPCGLDMDRYVFFFFFYFWPCDLDMDWYIWLLGLGCGHISVFFIFYFYFWDWNLNGLIIPGNNRYKSFYYLKRFILVFQKLKYIFVIIVDGTVRYLCPEHKYISSLTKFDEILKANDMWHVGCFLFVLMTGKDVFDINWREIRRQQDCLKKWKRFVSLPRTSSLINHPINSQRKYIWSRQCNL